MMSALFFSLVLIFSGVSTFFASTSYQSFESIFNTLNNTLPDTWVVTDEEKAYYDTTLIEPSVINHFKNNLGSYVKTFTVGFYYFDSETLEHSEERFVTGARISLKAELYFNKTYNKANTYIVTKGVL